MDNKQLVKDVKFCKSFIKKSSLTILNNIVFDKNVMYCTNNEIAIEFQTNLHSEKPFLVQAETIEKILSKQKDFEIEINRKMEIVLKNNSTINIDIDYDNLEDYPEIPLSKPTQFFCLLDEKGIANLKNIVYSAATDTIKPVFNSIYLHKTKDGVLAVTTDGRRLSETMIADDFCEDKEIELLVPLDAINLLLRLKPKSVVVKIEDKDESRTCLFEIDKRIRLVTRLYDGRFPQYKHAIPITKESDSRVIDCQEFIEVMEQALTVTSAPAHKSIWSVSEDNIAVNVDNPDGIGFSGQVKNETSVKETINLAHNTHHILETLKNMTGDKVRVYFTGVMAPVKICDDNITAIIMPISVQPKETH